MGPLPLVEMPCFHKPLSALGKNPSAAKPLREDNFLKFSGLFTWRNTDSWLYFCKHSTLNYSFVFVTVFEEVSSAGHRVCEGDGVSPGPRGLIRGPVAGEAGGSEGAGVLRRAAVDVEEKRDSVM